MSQTSLTLYRVLSIFAVRTCVFRIAVRDRKIVCRLADYIDAKLGPLGFSADEIRRPEEYPVGLVFVSYHGDKLPRNMLNEIYHWDFHKLACELEKVVDQFFHDLAANEGYCCWQDDVVINDDFPLNSWPDEDFGEAIYDPSELFQQRGDMHNAIQVIEHILHDIHDGNIDPDIVAQQATLPRFRPSYIPTGRPQSSPYHDTGDNHNSPSPL